MLRTLRRLFPLPTITNYSDPRIAERVAEKTASYNPVPPYLDIRGAKRILDFGGGCGVHYKQALAAAMDCIWVIVEQDVMVRAAMEYRQPQNLFFTTNLDDVEALLGGTPDLIYSNGALQYCPAYGPILDRLSLFHAPKMIWDRTRVSDGVSQTFTEHSYLSDHGPGDPIGSEAKVIVTCRPVRTSHFINAHWRYEYTYDTQADRWTFTRRT